MARQGGGGPRTWRRTTARLAQAGLTDRIQNPATLELQLWEAADRAYFRSQVAPGAPLTELSAGPYYLREHDHRHRHQVLRTGFGMQRTLEIVRNAMPSRVVSLPRGVRASMHLSLDPAKAVTRGPAEPPITRPKGYSWELYAHRQLTYVAGILEVELPSSPTGLRFETAFLYGSSWLDHLRAHVVWEHPELGEVELVVTATDPGALPAQPGAVSITGPVRSVDLRAEIDGLAREMAAQLPLTPIADVREPMPRCEMPSVRILGLTLSSDRGTIF